MKIQPLREYFLFLYRVDKMEMIELTENDRVLSDKTFDLSSYSKTMFQMFGGEETDVSIEFDNDLVGVVLTDSEQIFQSSRRTKTILSATSRLLSAHTFYPGL